MAYFGSFCKWQLFSIYMNINIKVPTEHYITLQSYFKDMTFKFQIR